jgi:hypothetical protein
MNKNDGTNALEKGKIIRNWNEYFVKGSNWFKQDKIQWLLVTFKFWMDLQNELINNSAKIIIGNMIVGSWC